MAIKRVLRMGAPSLLQKSSEVSEFNSRDLDQLIIDLWDTVKAENGAGLAAPQIGVTLRVVIFGFNHNPRYPDAPEIPPTVLINPQIVPVSEDMEEGWEGCLSVPGMRALVPRYTSIRYSGYDQSGKFFNCNADGFHARVVQHECDHLDGILYPQRIRNMQSFGFREELEQSGRLELQPCDD